jgi:hypothetical protein
MVTVVDAANLLKDYGSSAFLRDRGETAGEGDERTLVDLLVEQRRVVLPNTSPREVCKRPMFRPW